MSKKKKSPHYAAVKPFDFPNSKSLKQLEKIRIETNKMLQAFSPAEIEKISLNRFGKKHKALSEYEAVQLVDELRRLIKSEHLASPFLHLNQRKKEQRKKAKQPSFWLTFSAFESDRRRH